MIDLSREQLRTVRDILHVYAPDSPAFAFGSRVRGTAKKFSDLDIVIKPGKPLSVDQIGEVRWAFSDSDLPIKVDVLDWTELDDGFRKLIESELEPIHP